MHWVVQHNLFNERGFHALMEVLEHAGLPHTLVKVIPFGGGIEPTVEVEGPVIVMGSLTLTRYARERGWTPGAFLNDNFDFRVRERAVRGGAQQPQLGGLLRLRRRQDGGRHRGDALLTAGLDRVEPVEVPSPSGRGLG